jgi:hypothetical protein
MALGVSRKHTYLALGVSHKHTYMALGVSHKLTYMALGISHKHTYMALGVSHKHSHFYHTRERHCSETGDNMTKERTNKVGAVAQVFSEELPPFLESPSLLGNVTIGLGL